MFAKLQKNMAFLLFVLILGIFCMTCVQSTETQWLSIVKNQFLHGTFMTTKIHPDYYNVNPIPLADANYNCLWEGGFMGYNKKPVWDINPIAGFWSNVTQNTAVAVATQIHQCYARWSRMWYTKDDALNVRQVANSCAQALPDHHNPYNAEPMCLLRGQNWHVFGPYSGWRPDTGDAYCVCLDNIWPRGTGNQRVQAWWNGNCNHDCSGKSLDPVAFPTGGIHPYAWVLARTNAPTADGSVIDLHLFDLSQYANFFSKTALMVRFNPTNCPAMHTWTPSMAPLNVGNCQRGLPAVIPPTAGSPVHYYGVITGMTYNMGQFHFTMCTPTHKKYKLQLNPTTAQLEYVEDGNMSNVAQPGPGGVPSMGGRPACWNFVVGSVDYAPRAGGGSDIIKSSNWPLIENMAYYWTLHTELGGMMRVCPDWTWGGEKEWLEEDIWPGAPWSLTTEPTAPSSSVLKSTEDVAVAAKVDDDITPVEDHRRYMTEVIRSTVNILFSEEKTKYRLDLQKVKVTTPKPPQKQSEDVVTLEDAQLVEDQVNIPNRLINATLFMTKENIQNVDKHSLRIAIAIYISLHAEKKWDIGLTAEDKDKAIYKIFTEGRGACKSKNRKSDLKVLNCQSLSLHQTYNFANVGKTFEQIKKEQKAQGPIPQRQEECAAARAKLELECNKIPEDGKPESEWQSRKLEDAVKCLADTTSKNFKTVEILCNAKNIYPDQIQKSNIPQQEETTSQTIVKDEL